MIRVTRASQCLLRIRSSAYLHRHEPVLGNASVRTFRAATCRYKFRYPPQPCSGLTQQRRALSEDNVKWLWPAHSLIYMYDAGDRHGTRKGTFCVTFNTDQPLQKHHLTQTSLVVLRKFPNLRVCLRPRGNALWYCEPSKVELNFQVIDDEADSSELSNKVSEKPFTYTDPGQWRFVLVTRGNRAPCSEEKPKAALPYQYLCFVHMHHGLGDGIDCKRILVSIVQTLKDILAGRPVDEKQLSSLDENKEVPQLKEIARENLMKDPKRIQEVASTMPPADSTPLLIETFPQPNVVTRRTSKHVERIIEPVVMKQFQQKARQAGVSFNSFMTAAINTAIVELAKEAGNVRDTYTVSTNHMMSLRPFFKNTPEDRVGPFAAPVSHRSRLDQNAKGHFWEYATQLHEELRSVFKSGLALEQDAFNRMTQPWMSPDDYFTNPQPLLHDYSVTNLGVFTNSMAGDNKHLQVTEMYSYNLIHSFIHSNVHQLIMLNDRCFYTISYDTHRLSHNTANLLADKVVSVITDAIGTTGK